jgi:hypothetical protein
MSKSAAGTLEKLGRNVKAKSGPIGTFKTKVGACSSIRWNGNLKNEAKN